MDDDESSDDSVIGVKNEPQSDIDDIDDIDSPDMSLPFLETATSAPIPSQAPVKHESLHVKEEDLDTTMASTADPDVVVKSFSTSASLQELIKETELEALRAEILEAGVTKGLELIELFRSSLQPGIERNNDDARHWMKQLDVLQLEAKKHRTIIGVVGNTGAGKSSVINAVLDEERLVPTNCMRACTAVVTEMSYNDSEDEDSKYRAELEFIEAEDWERELNILYDEILDSRGNISGEVYNQDSDAAVAYAKIRAVYHKHTKDDIVNSSVEELMEVRHVQNLLGSVKNINCSEPSEFYHKLQHYVDSKEKVLTKDGKVDPFAARELEYWPLIKVVRIYVKAKALETGGVLVDLPGTSDSNAARAAVAQGYMRQCTGLWIVAPITRAVDDKAAKNLLGDTFRRQLKFDGTYSAVTFICSKTDDISITEAVDSLGLHDQMTVFDDELGEIDQKQRQVKRQIRELKGTKSDIREAVDDADENLEKWEALRERLEDGEKVFPPPDSKKRKHLSEIEENTSSDAGSPLTEEKIDAEIAELRQIKKDARRQRSGIDEKLEKLEAENAEFEAQNAVIDAKKSALCIAGRNKYSKTAIQQDFAVGIKEMDIETQEEENPDDFDPEDEIRDYEKVAQSLPVFCVSSRAFQKLSGRMVKDNSVPGFTTVEETEIPQLQAHCSKSTENGRAAACRRFLNSLIQLCNSFAMWASDDGTGKTRSGEDKDREAIFLDAKLLGLKDLLDDGIEETLAELREVLKENIFDDWDKAMKNASEAAVPAAQGWGAHRNDGGLLWSTYKATCRRNGVHAGVAGARDFNAQLAKPIYKVLANGWEQAFQRRTPLILKQSVTSFDKILQTFHQCLVDRAAEEGVLNPRLGMLGHQIKQYTRVFQDLANGMITLINEKQKDANREFTPVVQEKMDNAYMLCVAERGTGSFKRMKSHMEGHVANEKTAMFKEAIGVVEERLEEMCEKVRGDMQANVQGVFVAMHRDYRTLLGEDNADGPEIMPRWERQMRAETGRVLDESEEMYKDVLRGTATEKEKDVDTDVMVMEVTPQIEPVVKAEDDAGNF